MNEVNVEPVDVCDELREGVEPRFSLAPVVVLRPVTRERLNRGELHALRSVSDRFAIGPPCSTYAPAQFRKLRLREIHMKRTKRTGVGHGLLLSRWRFSLGRSQR